MVNADRDLTGLERMQKVCDDLGEQAIDKSCYLGMLADAYLHAGDSERAMAAVERGLEHARSTGEQYFAAELIRLRGEVHLQLKNDPQNGEVSFREAIALARKQGAKTWEMRLNAKSRFLATLTQGQSHEADKDHDPLSKR